MAGETGDTSKGAEIREARRNRRAQIQVTVITAAATVIAATVAGVFVLLGKDSDSPVPPVSRSVSCPEPARPVTRGRVVSFRYPGVEVKEMKYNLSYGKEGGAPWMYLELVGQVTGRVLPGHGLYLFGWADPASYDSNPEHNRGNGRYGWVGDEISPDENGCWILTRRRIGYAGMQGLTLRYYPALVPDDRQGCMAELVREDRRHDGLTYDALMKCGVIFLGYTEIRTEPI
jgi:hypothetical protein